MFVIRWEYYAWGALGAVLIAALAAWVAYMLVVGAGEPGVVFAQLYPDPDGEDFRWSSGTTYRFRLESSEDRVMVTLPRQGPDRAGASFLWMTREGEGGGPECPELRAYPERVDRRFDAGAVVRLAACSLAPPDPDREPDATPLPTLDDDAENLVTVELRSALKDNVVIRRYDVALADALDGDVVPTPVALSRAPLATSVNWRVAALPLEIRVRRDDDDLVLRWARVPRVDGYRVQRQRCDGDACGDGDWRDVAVLDNPDGPWVEYRDDTAHGYGSPANVYRYRMRTVLENFVSPWSPVLMAPLELEFRPASDSLRVVLPTSAPDGSRVLIYRRVAGGDYRFASVESASLGEKVVDWTEISGDIVASAGAYRVSGVCYRAQISAPDRPGAASVTAFGLLWPSPGQEGYNCVPAAHDLSLGVECDQDAIDLEWRAAPEEVRGQEFSRYELLMWMRPASDHPAAAVASLADDPDRLLTMSPYMFTVMSRHVDRMRVPAYLMARLHPTAYLVGGYRADVAVRARYDDGYALPRSQRYCAAPLRIPTPTTVPRPTPGPSPTLPSPVAMDSLAVSGCDYDSVMDEVDLGLTWEAAEPLTNTGTLIAYQVSISGAPGTRSYHVSGTSAHLHYDLNGNANRRVEAWISPLYHDGDRLRAGPISNQVVCDP